MCGIFRLFLTSSLLPTNITLKNTKIVLPCHIGLHAKNKAVWDSGALFIIVSTGYSILKSQFFPHKCKDIYWKYSVPFKQHDATLKSFCSSTDLWQNYGSLDNVKLGQYSQYGCHVNEQPETNWKALYVFACRRINTVYYVWGHDSVPARPGFNF